MKRPLAVAVVAGFLLTATPIGGRTPALLIESESLFNDGTVAVAFGVALELAIGHDRTPSQVALKAVWAAEAGCFAGALVALGITPHISLSLVQRTFCGSVVHFADAAGIRIRENNLKRFDAHGKINVLTWSVLNGRIHRFAERHGASKASAASFHVLKNWTSSSWRFSALRLSSKRCE